MKSTIIKTGVVCLLMGALSACSDSDSTFSPGIGSEAFSFTPIAGGAVMHYALPSDEDIVGLKVKYNNYSGTPCTVSGSVLSDSLTLTGFNEAQTDVPATVRLERRNGDESEPINVTFSTNASGPIALFDSLQVLSGWDGFTVITNNKAGASGMVNIFYKGINPYTQQPDTILLSTTRIKEGIDTLSFAPQQQSENFDVIIRTEDLRGNSVKEEVYHNVSAYVTQILPRGEFTFEWSKSLEVPGFDIGVEQLFSGDTKGISYFDNTTGNHAFLGIGGPGAIGEPMYADLKKNRLTAGIRIYAPVNIQGRNYSSVLGRYAVTIGGTYYDIIQKLPCDVSLYGAKDDGGTGSSGWDSKEWTLLGTFSQDERTEAGDRWCHNCQSDDAEYNRIYSTKAAAEAGPAIYMTVPVSVEGQGEGYRYLKIVVNKCFITVEGRALRPPFFPYYNWHEYVFMQQLEIYTNK